MADPTTSTGVAPTTTIAPHYQATMSNVTEERLAHSYTSDCPVRPNEVVLVTLTHWGFDGETHVGEIVVAREEGDHVVEIFHRLFAIGYPIESVIPIGDLPPGIEDTDPSYNNTSGLHCRFVAGTNHWSEHARGLAIDINPFLNPYKTDTAIWPEESGRYLDRTLGEPGMIVDGDDVVGAFDDAGWRWGGHWASSVDYQHFSVTGR
ncbi:MAG: M15 family metallopeptidase [Acidimicrobiia bacterium]